jgi:hypothetical protein
MGEMGAQVQVFLSDADHLEITLTLIRDAARSSSAAEKVARSAVKHW